MKSSDRSVSVAQLGARMHYAVPRLLQQTDLLQRLYTDICAVRGWPRILRTIPESWCPGPLRRLRDRVPEDVPREKITSFTTFGLRYAQKLKRARNESERTAAYLWGGRTFTSLILRQGIPDVDGIYAFRSAGLELLKHARREGKKAFLEQPIAPKESERELLKEEHERHGEWQDAPGQNMYTNEYAAREKQEWEQSDVIFCGSNFVRSEIKRNGGPVERCVVVPYGVNLEVGSTETRGTSKSKLRVLTVGTVGLRKGAPYILQAARKCASIASFRMVGGIEVRDTMRSRLAEHIDLTGRVPRTKVQKHYQWADVFLLPSICEGSATVTYEAMAAGLPVICTPNTGSIVRDGKEGFIVPIRDSDAIAEKINELSSNRDLLEHLSRRARVRYKESGSLRSYRERLVNTITSELDTVSG